MRLHEVLACFSDIIRSYEVVEYEIADLNSRLKLNIVFANGTELSVRDILLDGRRRKYAFHWQEGSGRLIARWDNAAHWPEIETFPHHKHLGEAGQVVASEGTTLEEVLGVIRANMS
jgi:Family of unknown function (DUF6516)